MKKGMTVILDNKSYILVDSVTYSNEKFFAAVLDDITDDSLYFFKLITNDEGNSLELINKDTNEKVVDALLQHMDRTF